MNKRKQLSNKLIRNPHRDTSQVKKTTYVPEYVRLGLEPESNKINPSDFMFQSKNRQPSFVTSSKGKLENIPSKIFVKSLSDQQLAHKPQRGQNWYPSEQDLIDDEQSVEDYANADISYNDVSFPGQSDDADDQETLQENSDFSAFSPGNYCIILDNEIIYTSPSIKELEEVIDYITSSEEAPFKNIDLNNLKVIKCLEIKFGIAIKDV